LTVQKFKELMKKKTIIISLLLIIFLSAFFFLRSPYISDALKGLILPEIENAINRKVAADKIYVNIFPLFIGINDLKIYENADDKEILHAKRVKGYIGFFELLGKRIAIKRLSIKEPFIDLEKEKLEEIIASFDKPKTREKDKTVVVTVKSLQIDNGRIFLRDNNRSLSLIGLNSDVLIVGIPEVRLSIEKALFTKDKDLSLDGRVALHFIFKNNNIDLKSLKVSVTNSELNATGTFDLGMSSGELQTEVNLLVDSLKKAFGLTNKGDGFLSAKGSIKAINLKSGFEDIFLDLKVRGDLYLETLMELLKVKEPLYGRMSFSGDLKGQLKDIHANADAELKNGSLFGVNIDKLNCKVEYAGGKMKFTEGIASLFEGSATAEAVINLPVVNHFSFMVTAKDVSSKKIFELIKWDPGLPEGKVNGDISSSGSVFNPNVNFVYTNKAEGKDIMGRVREIKGNLSMKDKFISFPDMTLSTPKSGIQTTGSVDLKNNKLIFTGSGRTSDLREITSPYFSAVSGPGRFNISLSGILNNPVIDISFASDAMSFATSDLGMPDVFNNKVFSFNSIKTTLTYDKNHLLLKEFLARRDSDEFSAKGNIYFKKATKLFEVREPDYDLHITVNNADIANITGTVKGLPDLRGALSADFNMKGIPDSLRFSGGFNAKRFSYADSYIADALSGKFSYAKREFLIKPAAMKKGDSVLNLSGTLSLDKRFTLNAEGKRLKISDILSGFIAGKYKTDIITELYLDNLTIKGEGHFNNPHIEMRSSISGKKNRVGWLSKGNITAKISGKQADLNLSLMDERLNITGRAGLSEKLPWSASAEIRPANYAPLVSGFLKDAPDDMLINLTGKITANGDKDNINAGISLSRAHVFLYGVGLSNSSDIIVNIRNKSISIENFSMHGDDAEFSISGGVVVGNKYDLFLVGTSSITPLKVLSKEIETLRGKAYFAISVSGGWEKPEINGGIDMANGALALKSIPNRFSSVSAYFYVDDDRIIVKNIDGKFAGGDFSASGTAFLDGMTLKNFFLEAKLNDLTMYRTKDLWGSFDGILYYRGSLKSQELTGDIYIKRANYSQRIEWKSWLLQARKREMPKLDVSRLGQTTLNVRIKGENLVINNNIAETTAKMDMIVRGTISKPVLLGRLNTDKGTVYFRNNEFKVLKARVDFIDIEKTTPTFDIVAETKVKNYLIKLRLDGNFEHFDLALTSDPPLNESDIFSLLTVGQVGKQMKGLEGGIGTSEATSFLAGKLQDVLEERVKTITGIDRIQIDPQVSKATGTINPRITVSKKILGDKLHVTYSASTGEGEEQIWKLEYFLDRNISVVGVRDERGGLGGDVTFRFEFK